MLRSIKPRHQPDLHNSTPGSYFLLCLSTFLPLLFYHPTLISISGPGPQLWNFFHSSNTSSRILRRPLFSPTSHVLRGSRTRPTFPFLFFQNICFFRHLLGQGRPVGHVLIKRTAAAHTSTFRPKPAYSTASWNSLVVSGGKGHALAPGHVENTCGHRKSRLCQDRTPSTAAFSLLSVDKICTARPPHVDFQNKHFRSQR